VNIISKVIEAEMYLPQVYVALGGNIGDSYSILGQAIEKISLLDDLYNLNVSRFYSTTPVSALPQDSYINAVCSFNTGYTARTLLKKLQEIEKTLGKKEKLKEAPRIIDLDILFYGVEIYKDYDLEIPHPRWSERLFVVAPLADLVDQLLIPDTKNSNTIVLFDVRKYLQNFPNIHEETVTPITENLRRICTQ
jgi:2-amino-4-hydroxy-6-hydroxymethyldihydropteridine diphosphokinase